MNELTIRRPDGPVLTDAQWERAVSVFADENRGFIMPHELGNEALIGYDVAAELLRTLGAMGAVGLGTLVYHRCSEAPVAVLDGDRAHVTIPWTCPECEYEYDNEATIGYNLMAKPIRKEGTTAERYQAGATR